MKNVLFSLALGLSLALPVGAALAAEPIKQVCKTNAPGVEVRFVGQHADLIEIHDTFNGVHYKAYIEARAEMGGPTGYNKLSCKADVSSTRNIVAIRTGHNNDYIHMYGIQRRVDGRLVFHQYRDLYLDGTVTVKTGTNRGMESIMTRLGRNNDRFHRYCWDGANWYISVSPNAFTGGWLNCSGRIPANRVRAILPADTSVTPPWGS